ncbi:MAG: DUF2867 domain-containing protein [Comamonas sp.]|jgi:hypothetical protein|nr:DUF2867 domain-containing protein [Comamonas sp.]
MKPLKVSVPANSIVSTLLNDAYFADAYAVADPAPQRSAMEQWLDIVKSAPVWVERAMDLRNAVVSRLGLKDLGRLGGVDSGKPAWDYRIGDRVGIFSLQHMTSNEVVMADSDSHLDVHVSLFKSSPDDRVVVSTVVHVKNWFGRLYMLPVAPVHRIIVPTTLSRLTLSTRFSS